MAASRLRSIRLAFTTPNSQAFDWTVIHHDAQGSVRGVTSSAGTKAERTIYRPYGNADSTFTWYWGTAASTPESRSYIGERLDAAAGPQERGTRCRGHCRKDQPPKSKKAPRRAPLACRLAGIRTPGRRTCS